jgi:ferredoxin
MVGFFEFSMMRLADHPPKAKLARAYEAYFSDNAFPSELSGGDTVIGRALAHESALFDDLLSEILDWERASALVEGAQKLAVTNCYCRHKAHHLDRGCDNPMDMCMSLGVGADYLIRHGLARSITNEEGLELLEAGREAGLAHIADNLRSDISYICSCCSCCCDELASVRRGMSVVVPSGFQATADVEKCNGCARCLRSCPVDAISLVARRALQGEDADPGGSRRLGRLPKSDVSPQECDGHARETDAGSANSSAICATEDTLSRRPAHSGGRGFVHQRPLGGPVASVDQERCIGCAVCVGSCRQQAMRMERRSSQRYVPANSVEFAVRSMMERGRVADLLIDGTAGRGAGFAHAVLRAILSLPPAERVLASEQIRSRFVRYALERVQPPG